MRCQGRKGVIVEVGLEGRVGVCQVERGDWKNTAEAEGCAETGKSRCSYNPDNVCALHFKIK